MHRFERNRKLSCNGNDKLFGQAGRWGSPHESMDTSARTVLRDDPKLGVELERFDYRVDIQGSALL